jgi:EmrB/QacA subfamily drug resistance transporter
MAAILAWRPERRWTFFVLACLSLLMFSIDFTIVAVALRTIVEDLDTTLVLVGWTMTAFALAQTIVLPLIGKLGENFGQMRVFVACVVLFILGSLLCGIAPNIYVLIACRVLQALGGGGFMPSATAIVAREFPQTRSKMIGLFASIIPLGGIVGPNLGGYIIQNYGWREVFLVNVPIGVIILPILIWQMRAAGLHKAPQRKGPRRLDLAGSGLFAGSIVSFLIVLSMLGDDPDFIKTVPFWTLLVASVVFLLLFIRQERRAIEPVIELSLVTRHPFLIVNLYNFAFGACVFGCFTFVPYFASVQYGMGPQDSGAVLTPRSITMVGVSTVTSLFLMRFGYRIPILVGMAIMVVSMLMIGQGWDGVDLGFVSLGPFGLLAAIVGLTGVSMGLVMPSSNNAALDLLPDRTAVVAGLRGFFRQIGGVIGTASIVVALSLTPDKAAGMRTIYTTLGLLLVVTIPLAFLIPDVAREKRHAATRTADATTSETSAVAAAATAPEPAGTMRQS